MERDDSWPPLQGPATNLYPEQYECSAYHLIILSFYPCPCFPNGLSPWDSSTRTLYVLFVSPLSATCLTPPIHFHVITLIIFSMEYKSLLCILLQLLAVFHFYSLGPCMYLGIFLKTHSVCSCFKMKDKVVHLCPTRGRYIVVYFLHVIYWNKLQWLP